MITYACAVRDLATETFGRPFFVNHSAHAMRSFSDEVNNAESEFHRHAKDYELWQLASFNDAEGAFIACEQRIARAVDLLKGE